MSKKQQGLTLVELMVTLAVAIILIAVGMPMFSGIVANNRATTQTNNFLGAFKLARSEAVKRGGEVVARRSGATWNEGWRVFVDEDADGELDDGEEVLRTWPALTGGSINPDGVDFVSFIADGSQKPPADQIDFELDQAEAAGSSKRCVTIALNGQVRMKKEKHGVTWTCI